MADEQQSAPDQQGAGEAEPQPTSPLRVILFSVLGLLIVALAYDRLWARKQCEEAAARIDKLTEPVATDKMIADAEPKNFDEVHHVIGRELAEEKNEGHYLMTRYSWRSGLPWKTHDLYVVYTATNPPLYHSWSMGQPPSDLPHPNTLKVAPAAGPAGDAENGADEAASDGPLAEEPAPDTSPGDDDQASETQP